MKFRRWIMVSLVGVLAANLISCGIPGKIGRPVGGTIRAAGNMAGRALGSGGS